MNKQIDSMEPLMRKGTKSYYRFPVDPDQDTYSEV